MEFTEEETVGLPVTILGVVVELRRKKKWGEIMAKKKPKYYVRPDGLHEAIRVINGKRVPFRSRTDAEVE